MKRILAILITMVLLPAMAWAVNLQWTYDEAHDITTGFTVYYSDGQADYNKSFPKQETTVNEAEGWVEWPDIEQGMNLHPGVEYDIWLVRYNETGKSEASNIISYTREAYVPPTDQLPDPVSPSPSSGVDGLEVR